MTELEERFVTLSKELQAKAKQAAEVRRLLIMVYLTNEYPGIPYTLTINADNLLALDLVFTGLSPEWSRTIVGDVTLYMQRLLEENEK